MYSFFKYGLILLLFKINFCTVCRGQNSELNWQLVTDKGNFNPRDGGGAHNPGIVYDNKMWLNGGWNLTNDANTQWNSTDGVNWVRVNPYRNIHAIYDNKMWYVNENVGYSSDGLNWTMVQDNLNEAGYCIVHDNKLWLISDKNIYLSVDGVNWDLVSDTLPWPYRNFFGAIAFNNKMWVMGGINYTGVGNSWNTYNDVWFSENGINWTLATKNAPWEPRRFFTPVEYKGKIWVMAGQGEKIYNDEAHNNINDVWFSDDGKKWYKLTTDVKFPHRHAPYTFNFNDAIYVIAGYANDSVFYNDVWKLEIPSKLIFTSVPDTTAKCEYVYQYKAHADFNMSQETVFYQLINNPSWLSIDSVTGLINGTPAYAKDMDTIVTVKAYDQNGESAEQSYKLIVGPRPVESEKDETFVICPSITTGSFDLYFAKDNIIDYSVKVFNINGALVYQEENLGAPSKNFKTIELSIQMKGVYIVIFQTGNLISSKKIILI